MASLGTMRPKLIARMMRAAVMASAAVPAMSATVVCELSATLFEPARHPEKESARHQRDDGGEADGRERHVPTARHRCQDQSDTRQATKAPVAALAPRMASAPHLSAWASMPTATGQGSICSGVEKKMLKEATATPAAIVSSQRGTALPAGLTGSETPSSASPSSSPVAIATTTRPAYGLLGGPRTVLAFTDVVHLFANERTCLRRWCSSGSLGLSRLSNRGLLGHRNPPECSVEATWMPIASVINN
jgi:hypothetical protein